MARVLIVDDSDSMRLLVRLSLEMDASFEVVGEAANGLDGLRKSEELDPDLIVMDLSMPVMDGIEATRRIKQGRPEVGIVAFSAAGEEAVVEKVLAAGAYARVDKEDLIGLLHALQELATKRVGTPIPADSTRYIWVAARDGVAAAVASVGAFTRNLGNARVASALGVGGAALIAVAMFLITVAPGGHDPSSVVRPEVVLGPQSTAPQVGSIELKGDVVVPRAHDRHRGEDAGDATEPALTVEVATFSEPSSGSTQQTGGNGGSHGGPGDGHHNGSPNQHGSPPDHHGDPPGHGPANDGPPNDSPPNDGPAGHAPPGLAKKPGHVPPGLAKKPGHRPPGQAKKQGHSSHPGKGAGKH